MPNIFAVIGSALRAFPGIGVITDVPAFRDPGPGREAQKRAEDRISGGAQSGCNHPAYTPPSKEVQAQRHANERLVLANAMAGPPKPKPLQTYNPLPPKVDFEEDVRMGDCEFLNFHPMLEPIPVDECLPPPICPATAPQSVKNDCWENMILSTMEGMAKGGGGAIASAAIFCPLAFAPPNVAGCAIGFTIVGFVGGGFHGGLSAYKDHCKAQRLSAPPQPQREPNCGPLLSRRMTFTPKMEQLAYHQAFKEAAQARANLYNWMANREWMPTQYDKTKYDAMVTTYRELDRMMQGERPFFAAARVQQLREWVESLPADAPEELFA